MLAAGSFVACSDGNNGKNEDAAVATWVQDTDQTNFYIFYGDKTVEYYESNKCIYTRNELSYEGAPTTTGALTIKNRAGITIKTFIVVNANSSVVATEMDSGTKFTMQKTSSNKGTENNVVCKWVFDGDESSYYIFYADKTVDVYSYGKLENKGLTKYTGDPTKAGGTVKINLSVSGTTQELLSYTIKSINNNIVTASYNGFEVKFNMSTGSDSTSPSSGEQKDSKSDVLKSGDEYYVYYFYAEVNTTYTITWENYSGIVAVSAGNSSNYEAHFSSTTDSGKTVRFSSNSGYAYIKVMPYKSDSSNAGSFNLTVSNNSGVPVVLQTFNHYSGGNSTAGNNATENNSVVCKWVFDGDESSYYIFYADNSVDVYSYGNLENGGMTKYTGDPSKEGGTVKINVVMSGITQELLSYDIKSISGNVVTTSYNGLDVKFIMGTGSSDSTGGNKTSDNIIPSEPQNVRASASGLGYIDVSWDAVNGATSYVVYYRLSSEDSEENLQKIETEGSYITIGNLIDDKTYDFWVIAKNSTGDSGRSDVVSARSYFPAPTGVDAYAQGTGYARVSWNSVKGATSYEVWAAKLDSYGSEQEKFLCATGKGVTVVVSLTSDARYRFYVKAVSGTKTSGYSSGTLSITIH